MSIQTQNFLTFINSPYTLINLQCGHIELDHIFAEINKIPNSVSVENFNEICNNITVPMFKDLYKIYLSIKLSEESFTSKYIIKHIISTIEDNDQRASTLKIAKEYFNIYCIESKIEDCKYLVRNNKLEKAYKLVNNIQNSDDRKLVSDALKNEIREQKELEVQKNLEMQKELEIQKNLEMQKELEIQKIKNAMNINKFLNS